MKKSGRLTLTLLLLVSVVFLSACGSGGGSGSNASPSPSSKNILSADTIPVDDTNLTLTSSDGETFTYSYTGKPPAIKPGNILLSGVGNGYLRKVISVQDNGGTLTVTTSQATLDEAFEKLSLDFSRQLTPDDATESTPLQKGVNPSSNKGEFFLQFTDVVLYDADGNPSTTDDQIVLDGDITFNPQLNFQADIEDYALNKLTFTVDMDETANVDVTASLAFAQASWKKEVARYSFAPIVITTPWPVVIVPVLTISVGVDGEVEASVTASVAQQASLTGGLSYDNGAWSPISDFTNNFDFQPPELIMGCSLEGYASPELDLMIYGVTGPYAKLKGYLEMNADPLAEPWWDLYGGLKLSAGVKVEVLSHVIAGYEADVIDYKLLLASASASNHAPTWSIAPSDVAISVNSAYDQTNGHAIDSDEGDTLACSLTNSTCSFGVTVGGSGPNTGVDCNISFTAPASAETCSVTVQAADDGSPAKSVSATIGITVLTGGSTSAAISAGYDHTCALTTAGGVKCWGLSTYGELGDGTTTWSNIPVNVVGLSSGVAAIAAGYDHTCALTTTGGVKCWGRNNRGQIGDNSTIDRHSPADVVGLTSGVSAIVAGDEHTCALTTAGGVKCWGYNNYGELGDNNAEYFSAIPVDVAGLSSGVMAIAAGFYQSCALTTSGAVKCWGRNNYGQVGDNSTIDRPTPVDVVGLSSGAATIAAGSWHTCAIMTTGGIKCWGDNEYGQIGDNTITQRNTPTNVAGLSSGVTAITAGGGQTCALTTGGGAKCWGWNYYGQIGDNSTTNRLTSVDVVGLSSGVGGISAGGLHTCALTASGGFKCWGWNAYGQLGNNSITDSWTPVDVFGL